MLEQAVVPAFYPGELDEMKEAFRYVESWQEVLVEDDAQLIWERLYGLIEKIACDEMTRFVKTQELFLQLLTGGRIDRYIEEEFTDLEIEEDLISQLAILQKTV